MEIDAREKLLSAGTRLFAQKGFAAVSIRQLSQAAETNSALISYYFGGKEGLYAAVLEKQFSPIDSVIASVRERDLSPVERIEAYAQGVLAAHTRNPYIIRFLYSEFANPTPAFEAIQKEVRKIYAYLHQSITDGITCGQFRADLNPAHAAFAIAGMMNFYFIAEPIRRNFQPAGEVHDAQYFGDALKIYLNGVIKHGD